jgi:hypothetical protein
MPHCSEFAWRLCRHVNDERVEHPPSSLNARRSHGYKRGCRKCRAGNRLYRAWVQAWPECSTLSQRVYCKWTRKINAISAASRSPDTSTTEQCSCAVTIKASKIGRRALNQHSTAGSIAFGTDRSLRHRVSSDPIPNPRLNPHPSTFHPRAPLVSFSRRPALSCPRSTPYLSTLYTLRPPLHTVAISAAPQVPQQHSASTAAKVHTLANRVSAHSPAHCSSGGLTAQPTLASHRIADWPCRLLVVVATRPTFRKTPLAALATPGTQ